MEIDNLSLFQERGYKSRMYRSCYCNLTLHFPPNLDKFLTIIISNSLITFDFN